jgi:hypothetical protein
MRVHFRKLTLIERLDQIIDQSDGDHAIDYIELDYLEMGEFIESLDETGRNYEKHSGFDEVYYTYRNVRFYEERV